VNRNKSLCHDNILQQKIAVKTTIHLGRLEFIDKDFKSTQFRIGPTCCFDFAVLCRSPRRWQHSLRFCVWITPSIEAKSFGNRPLETLRQRPSISGGQLVAMLPDFPESQPCGNERGIQRNVIVRK
jgi:hypothetical protein